MSAAHTATQTVRKYYKRFLGLGWARVFLVLGVLFTLVAIANPLWYTTEGAGGDYTTSTYGWTTVTRMDYANGVWTETTITSYAARGFSDVAIANSMGASYLAAVILLIVLIVAIALFSLDWVRSLPSLGLLIIGLVVVVIALVAVLYPVLTVPGAAAADLSQPAITGFWGSTSAPAFSWGAAIGWWVLLIGVLLGIVGGALPFLQAMRTPVSRTPPPPPREWQVER